MTTKTTSFTVEELDLSEDTAIAYAKCWLLLAVKDQPDFYRNEGDFNLGVVDDNGNRVATICRSAARGVRVVMHNPPVKLDTGIAMLLARGGMPKGSYEVTHVFSDEDEALEGIEAIVNYNQ